MHTRVAVLIVSVRSVCPILVEAGTTPCAREHRRLCVHSERKPHFLEETTDGVTLFSLAR